MDIRNVVLSKYRRNEVMDVKSNCRNLLLGRMSYCFDSPVRLMPIQEEFDEMFESMWSDIDQLLKRCYIDGYEAGARDLHASYFEEGMVMPKQLEKAGIRTFGEKKFEPWWDELGIVRPLVGNG